MISRIKLANLVPLLANAKKHSFGFIFLLYPAIYMAPVLIPSTRTRLGQGRTDMNGTVLFAQHLKNMRFPWSQNSWMGYPEESNFWLLSRVVQSIHWFIFYFFTRFFSAFYSVNLSILLGWTLTGLLAFLLAREVGITKFSSIWVGVITQSLPWLREKVEDHLSYVYVAVPLLIIICVIKFVKFPSSKTGFLLASSLSFAFVFDLYWFFFGFYIATACLLFIFLNKFFVLAFSRQVVLVTVIAALVASAIQTADWLLALVNKPNANFASRTLGVPDHGFVFRYSGSPADYINRNPLRPFFTTSFDPSFGSDNIFYVGVSIIVLSIFGFKRLFKTQSLRVGSVLCITLILTFLLSVRSINFGPISIPAINQYFKFVMPGTRVFVRSGLITEAILVVIAGLGVEHLLLRFKSSSFKAVCATLLTLVVLFDLQPFAKRSLYDDGEFFREQSSIMSSSDNHAFLNAHPEFFRTSEFLNQPTFNTLSNLWKVRLFPHAAKGSSEMAKYLDGLGIGFVIAPVNSDGFTQISGWIQDSTFFTTVLNESDFIPIGDDFTTSDSGDISLRLLQVNSRSFNPDHSCADCTLALGDISPQLLFDGTDPGYQQQIALWANEPKLSIYPREIDSVLAKKFRIRITFISAGGSAATPQRVRFRVGDKNGEFDLSLNAGVTKDFWVPKGESLLLDSMSPCFVPSEQIEGNTDGRRFCWGFSSMLIEAVR